MKGARMKLVDHIINGACDYYGADRKEVCTSVKGTQKFRWKKYLIVILYIHTDLTFTEIMQVLGYKSYPAMKYNFDILTDRLYSSMRVDDKTKLIYNNLIKYLNL